MREGARKAVGATRDNRKERRMMMSSTGETARCTRASIEDVNAVSVIASAAQRRRMALYFSSGASAASACCRMK